MKGLLTGIQIGMDRLMAGRVAPLFYQKETLLSSLQTRVIHAKYFYTMIMKNTNSFRNGSITRVEVERIRPFENEITRTVSLALVRLSHVGMHSGCRFRR